nr:MFS transporter [Phaeacidiphilus oryzae]
MMIGSMLNPINSSIIAVALVPIGVAFGAPPSETAWLVSALYLATALGQPVVGRLIDLFGPRRLFLLSTALVGLAGVVGTLAPDLGVLIAARVLLGFGTCAGYPAAMSLIRAEARRTGEDSPAGVLTVLAVTNQTIAVIGPSLGGLLIGLGGWRTTFALNIPLALAALVLGWLRLPRTAAPASVPDAEAEAGSESGSGSGATAEAGRRRAGLARQLDLPGMAVFAVMLVSLLLFLMDLTHLGPVSYALLAVAVLAGAAFARRERRVESPFIDLRVLAGNAPLLRTYGRTLAAYVVAYSVLYGFTQWMEEGRGLTPSETALMQLPMFVVAIGVSTLTGRRKGVRGKLIVGALGQIVACAMMLLLGGGSALWLVIAVGLVFGVPQGLNSLALQNSVYYQSDPENTAASAGLMRTFAYLGSMVASAATAWSYGAHVTDAGLHHLASFMLAAGLLYLLVTVLDRGLARLGGEAESAGE